MSGTGAFTNSNILTSLVVYKTRYFELFTIRRVVKFCFLLYTLPIMYKYLKQFNDLRSVVQKTQTTNTISSVYKTIRVLYMSLVSQVNQRFYGSISMNKNISYVQYFHNSKWYYFPIVSKRGPKKVIDKALVRSIDVTDKVKMLVGPNVDFYGYTMKPKDFGFDSLTIVVDGDEKKFNSEHNITL